MKSGLRIKKTKTQHTSQHVDKKLNSPLVCFLVPFRWSTRHEGLYEDTADLGYMAVTGHYGSSFLFPSKQN